MAFTAGGKLEGCIQKAHNDLSNFFDNLLEEDREDLKEKFSLAEKSLNLESNENENFMARFGLVLKKLEDDKSRGPIEDWPEIDLLHYIRRALNDFSPSAKSQSVYYNENFLDVPLVRRFCEFVANQISASNNGEIFSDFQFTVGEPTYFGIDMHGYRSWLLVRPVLDQSSSLIALCDQEALLESSSDNWLCVNRWVRCVLHELGHARLDIDYYVSHRSGARGAYSLPSQETSAWMYANTVLLLVSSLRAQLDRWLDSESFRDAKS